MLTVSLEPDGEHRFVSTPTGVGSRAVSAA